MIIKFLKCLFWRNNFNRRIKEIIDYFPDYEIKKLYFPKSVGHNFLIKLNVYNKKTNKHITGEVLLDNYDNILKSNLIEKINYLEAENL